MGVGAAELLKVRVYRRIAQGRIEELDVRTSPCVYPAFVVLRA